MPRLDKAIPIKQTPATIPEVFSNIKDEFTYKFLQNKVQELLDSVSTLEKQKSLAILAIDELNKRFDSKEKAIKETAREEIEAEKAKLQDELESARREQGESLLEAKSQFEYSIKSLRSQYDTKLLIYNDVCGKIENANGVLIDTQERTFEEEQAAKATKARAQAVWNEYLARQDKEVMAISRDMSEISQKKREAAAHVGNEELRLRAIERGLDIREKELDQLFEHITEREGASFALEARLMEMKEEIDNKLSSSKSIEAEAQARLDTVLQREVDLKANWKMYSKEKRKLDVALRREE